MTEYFSLRALALVPLALTATLIPCSAVGQDVDTKGGKALTQLGQRIDMAAKRAAPEHVVDELVGEFRGKKFTFDYGTRRSLAESDVRDLRQKGLGFGEISILLALANKSGDSVSNLLAMRRPGEGWGKLARDLNLNLGSVIKSVKAMEQGLDRVALERGDKREGRGQVPNNADQPAKHEETGHPERRVPPERHGR